MANFDDQIMGITGLTISGSSTAPSQAELSTFLADGVLDVTNRILSTRPADAEQFMRVAADQTSQGYDTNGADVISVLREDGVTAGNLRPCTPIKPHLQYLVTDPESLHFASKFNPVYMIDTAASGVGGKVNIYPAPGSSPNRYNVYYVNNEPVDEAGNTLAHNDSDLGYFPKQRIYLVVLYAAIKSLECAMADIGKPSVASDSTGVELTALTSLDAENTIDDFDGNAIEFDQWFSTATHLIEDEEDTELANVHLNKISTYLQAYQSQLQGNTSEYQWMQYRLSFLQQQYDKAFGMIPKAAEKKEAG